MSGTSQTRQKTPQMKVMKPSGEHGHVAKLWMVKPIAQSGKTTCWEAVGRMAYRWKFGASANYDQAAGNFKGDTDSKNFEEQVEYYYKHLKMKMWDKSFIDPGVIEKDYLEYSPVLIRLKNPKGHGLGHVVLLVGYSTSNWYYINPQSFDDKALHKTGGDQHAQWGVYIVRRPKDDVFNQMKDWYFFYPAER